MPRPNPLQCGGAGQPACPPEPALSKAENAHRVLNWYWSQSSEHRANIAIWAKKPFGEDSASDSKEG